MEGKIQEEKEKSRAQNRQLNTSPRTFYRTLIKDSISVEHPPEDKSMENYLRPLLKNEVIHNQEAQWIGDFHRLNETKLTMPEPAIILDKITRKLEQFANFKKPGTDMSLIFG